jgi:hypothetical protein
VTAGRSAPAPQLAALPPEPVRRRSPGLSRARRVQEAGRGNVNAWKHGIYAEIAATPEIAIETALIFASHGSLDPIADHRLCESLAIARVHYGRAVAAIAAEGYTANLVAAARDFGNRAERLERQVAERDVQRRAQWERAAGARDLSQYRPRPAVGEVGS